MASLEGFADAKRSTPVASAQKPATTTPSPQRSSAPLAGFDPLGALKRFGQGLDDFVDDAMDRKLGNGAEFYGKRKSNFYGADDPMKSDGRGGDQYQGPVGGGYFKRDAEGRPVTRKGTPIGWDKE